MLNPEAAFYAEKCECGHTRKIHDADADYDGERWQGHWGSCETPGCSCEKFIESDDE